MRLFDIRICIVLFICSSNVFAENGNFDNYIPINVSGITVFLKQELEVKPSSLTVPSDGSATGNINISWRLPEYNEGLYTLQSQRTLLQELSDQGEWVTIDSTRYTTSNGRTTVQFEGKNSGIYDYRLYRNLTLENNNTLKTDFIEYLEEPKKVLVWQSADLARTNTWPSIITVPVQTSNGSFIANFNEPTNYRFANGATYNFYRNESEVKYLVTNLTTNESFTRSFKFEDNREGTEELTDLSPGVYELTATFKAQIEFSNDYQILGQLGLLEGDSSSDDYRQEFSFVDDKPKTILVLPSPPKQLTKQVDEFGNALVTWEQIHHGVSFKLEHDQGSNNWQEIYSGNRTNYLATNLPVSDNRFRVRACMEEQCGDYSDVIIAAVDEINTTQCVPFEIDESFQ